MIELFTLGYQGVPPDIYFETIMAHGVETIVDVRRVPLSRKPGYSKKRLDESCDKRGLNYVHMIDLGTPSAVMFDFKGKHRSPEFANAVNNYLETQAEQLQALTNRVKTETCCLLCLEADINECHRLMIAEQVVRIIGEENIQVTHLSAP